jgi:hypothetical protein
VFGEIPASGDAARAQRSRWEGGRLRMLKEWTLRLATAVLRGQLRLIEPLLDLLSLPLAFQVLVLSLLLFSPTALLRDYAAAALGLVIVHVFFAVCWSGKPLRSVAALAAAPFYIVWKMTTLVAIFSASRKNAYWVRSRRESEAAELGTAK